MRRPSIVFGLLILIALILAIVLWDVEKVPHDPVQNAVDRGRDWITRHQAEDGMVTSTFTTRCRGEVKCAAETLTTPVDPALAALAALALETPAPARLKQWDTTDFYNLLIAAVAVSKHDPARPELPPVDFKNYDDCEIGWALDLGLDAPKLLEAIDTHIRNGQDSTKAIHAIRALVLVALKRPAAEITKEVDTFATPYPNQGKVDLHLWYWGLRAMKASGDRRLQFWVEDIRGHLLSKQKRGLTCDRGSWDPMDQWGSAGGRVYTTAIAVMILRLTQ